MNLLITNEEGKKCLRTRPLNVRQLSYSSRTVGASVSVSSLARSRPKARARGPLQAQKAYCVISKARSGQCKQVTSEMSLLEKKDTVDDVHTERTIYIYIFFF